MNRLSWNLVVLATALGLGAGCSSEADSKQDVGNGDVTPSDVAMDQSADLATPNDLASEILPPQDGVEQDLVVTNACLEKLAHREPFALFGDGPDTQIHVDAAFDGEAVWVAFNAPAEGSSSFAVFVTRVGCDGSVLVAPTEISNPDAGNQVDPEIVVSGDKVLVAWQADSGIFPNNMDIPYRVFSLDGSDLTDVYGVVLPKIAGTEEPGSIWMPRAVGDGKGAFWLAGSLALAEFTGFQMFLQQLTDTGLLQGDALHVKPEVSLSQVYPAVALGSDGAVWIVWSSEAIEGDPEILYGSIPKGATGLEQVYKARKEGATSAGDLVTDPSGQGFLVYTAEVGSETDVYVRPLDPASAALRSFGAAGSVDHSGVVRLGKNGGGAVAWYRNVSGLKNNIFAQPFEYNNGMFSVSTSSIQVTPEIAAPYALSFEHLGGGYYFIAWSQGNNPKFRVYGTFESL